MNEIKSLVLALFNATGLSKFLTSLFATILSFGVHNTAQFIAVLVAILSGVMAIRHYAVSIKLNKEKLKKLQNQKADAS